MAEWIPSTPDSPSPHEAGLQFNPTRQHAGQPTSQQSVQVPSIPLDESQEIAVDRAGKAVLLGDDDDDVESYGGRRSTTLSRPAKGPCPTWLRDSPGKTKGALCAAAALLLAFVAVAIAGILKLSSPAEGGGTSSMEAVQNAAMDPDAATVVPVPTPATPEPSPGFTTYSPTRGSATVPITKEGVDVLLPPSLEAKVPDFSDGLTAAEERSWSVVEGVLEAEIATLLSAILPRQGYALGPVNVNKFDGYVTGAIRTRTAAPDDDGGVRMRRTNARGKDRRAESTHAVVYSASVTVDCTRVNCDRARRTVADVAAELTDLEYLPVAFEEEEEEEKEVPVAAEPANVPPVATDPPVAVPVTANPTKRPVEVTEEIEEVEEVVEKVETPAPITPSPTDVPTGSPIAPVPVSPAPVDPVPEGPLSLLDRDGNCNENTPCGRCFGSCSSDDECEEGLACYMRRGYAYVPGCEGAGRPNQNYCYDPFADGLDEEVLLPKEEEYECDKKDRCEKCRGDCDEDEDCANGLYCYRRGEYELVPGCAGQGKAGTDYCFDPVDLKGIGDF